MSVLQLIHNLELFLILNYSTTIVTGSLGQNWPTALLRQKMIPTRLNVPAGA